MGVVTVKSTAIGNRDNSTARKLTDARLSRAPLQEAVATVEVATGNSSGSKYILAAVPSNARMSSLQVSSDDMGTGTAADIGLYKTTDDGGAVVDADFFASALSLNGGALVKSEVLHESGVFGVEDVELMLWEALGLSADPKIHYDIVATLTADADVGGTLSIHAKYV